MKRLWAAAAGALLLTLLASPAHAATGTSTSSEYANAYRVGLQAYTYGLPLLTTNATFLTMTSTDVSQGTFGPVNTFNSNTGANNASSTTVVAPGATSLSSIAWLDLTAGPQVLHVPKVTGHAFVLALLDPYTTNLVNLGSASQTEPGDYVVRDPAQRAIAVPAGAQALDVDYSRIWIIGSTQLKGPDDVTTVNAIQDGYTLTPLDQYVSGILPSPPGPTQPTITQYSIPTGLAFFDTLGQLLQQFPPPPRDAAALRSFATVGIGPGLAPSRDAGLSGEARQGLIDAVAAGPALIKKQTVALTAADFNQHNGYLLGGFGRYGRDYTRRAVISQIGLGAFVPSQAIYAMSWTDHSKNALTGSRHYVLHLTQPPPTREGWSLTVYNLKGALISNPISRFALTNTSALARNKDGSIDVFIQANEPKQADRRSNWLPVAAGQGFEVAWRLFAPKASAVPGILSGAGWQPPAITRS
ncbi:MAG: DUF1254 domain-containing protein [Actinomycetes bacterium]